MSGISTNRTLSTLLMPVIRICQWLGRYDPELLVKIRYYAKFKKFPNLKNPQDLNEKILWLKLYSDISRWVELADKYRVREYIEGLGLGHYLVKLYGKWDRAEEVDFESLPDDVIFKANNGDGKGTNLIVRDVKNADHPALRKLFRKWLSDKHVGDLSAEPQYKEMKPCIIAEEVLKIPEGATSLADYKIWCINGNPCYIMICNDRDENGGADLLIYDLNWNAHPEYSVDTGHYRIGKVLPKPLHFEEMLDIASRVSAGFPILRVDLYNIEGQIYFGELTFTSLGGMMNYYTDEFLLELGRMADISGIRKVRNL